MINDYIMAAFQTTASLFICLNIRSVLRDREIKGVSLWMIWFFTMWSIYGVWNWFLLKQFWSFASSVIMCVVYLAWLIMAIVVKYQLLHVPEPDENRDTIP